MVKNLTAEWMAQSYCRPCEDQDCKPVGNSSKLQNTDVLGALQPSSPPPSHRIHLKAKTKSTKEPKVTEKVADEESSADISCPLQSASPSCSVVSRSFTEDEEGEEESQSRGHRRVRTKFTSDQIHKLEKIFLKYRYLSARERTKTAANLQLSETQVRTWFQNRRMKLKREAQDLSARLLSPGLALHFQHHSDCGQRLPLAPAQTGLFVAQRPVVPLQHLVPYWTAIPPLLLEPFYPHV